MRPIKFRGRDMNGHFVYGLLTKKKIRSSGEIRWAVAVGNCSLAETIPVSPNSIAQLVGYDSDGNEVYEGDELVNENGLTYVAQLWSIARNPNNQVFKPDLDRLTLKEAQP